MHSTPLITPFPVNALPNKLAANVPYNIEIRLPFCSFVLFLILLLILCISNPIFIISSIDSFGFINAVVHDPQIFFQKVGSAADFPTDNPNDIKTHLVRGVSTLSSNGKPTVINWLRTFENPSS